MSVVFVGFCRFNTFVGALRLAVAVRCSVERADEDADRACIMEGPDFVRLRAEDMAEVEEDSGFLPSREHVRAGIGGASRPLGGLISRYFFIVGLRGAVKFSIRFGNNSLYALKTFLLTALMTA